jgi:cyanate permease
MATISPATLIAVHLLLAFTTISPVLPMVLQGLAYSIFAAALWPSVPYVTFQQTLFFALF